MAERKSKRRITLAFRISQNLYDRVKAASQVSGRSMSGEMEHRLELMRLCELKT